MRGEKRKKKSEPKAHWAHKKKKKERGWYVEAAEQIDRTTQGSRFIYALYSHAKGLEHPWHSSCAILQLSVRRLISLKK